ncbi:hypothetical protein [Kaarinaea lacus]
MQSNQHIAPCIQAKNLRRKIFLSLCAIISCFFVQNAMANSRIASAVMSFCAPNPTVPDVSSCSACHSTTNNRGPNDLTPAGRWSLTTTGYSNFCPPSNTPPPTQTPNPGTNPAPNPAPPPGMSPSPTPGMGMGRGGRIDDDDDDDDNDYEDDDDDGGSARSFRSRSRSSFGSASRRRGD